jgi:hypothetical protein
VNPLPRGERRFLVLFSKSRSFPYFPKIVSESRIEFGDFLLETFRTNVNCPGTPVLPFRIHSQNLHFPEGVDRILEGVFQALSDVTDAAHPGTLVPTKCLFVKFFRCNGTRAANRKVSEREPWKISYLRYLKDALREDRDQFDILLQAFLKDSLDTLEASACRNHINSFWKMVRKPIP